MFVRAKGWLALTLTLLLPLKADGHQSSAIDHNPGLEWSFLVPRPIQIIERSSKEASFESKKRACNKIIPNLTCRLADLEAHLKGGKENRIPIYQQRAGRIINWGGDPFNSHEGRSHGWQKGHRIPTERLTGVEQMRMLGKWSAAFRKGWMEGL